MRISWSFRRCAAGLGFSTTTSTVSSMEATLRPAAATGASPGKQPAGMQRAPAGKLAECPKSVTGKHVFAKDWNPLLCAALSLIFFPGAVCYCLSTPAKCRFCGKSKITKPGSHYPYVPPAHGA